MFHITYIGHVLQHLYDFLEILSNLLHLSKNQQEKVTYNSRSLCRHNTVMQQRKQGRVDINQTDILGISEKKQLQETWNGICFQCLKKKKVQC